MDEPELEKVTVIFYDGMDSQIKAAHCWARKERGEYAELTAKSDDTTGFDFANSDCMVNAVVIGWHEVTCWNN